LSEIWLLRRPDRGTPLSRPNSRNRLFRRRGPVAQHRPADRPRRTATRRRPVHPVRRLVPDAFGWRPAGSLVFEPPDRL